MAATVLVVEDEARIRELVRSYLEQAGYEVLSTGSGAEALSLMGRTKPDLIVLDLRLPDVPGETVAGEVRRVSRLPLLILTAKASEEDRVRGLELGADDYVTKPFSPRELVLRVDAILRRTATRTATSSAESFGDSELVIDEEQHRVTVRGSRVELTPTEWAILVVLARRPGRVFSRYELINRVRGYEFVGYERTIDSHVKNLRRKIERRFHERGIIETVVGAGYRFALPRDD
jgi:DNA-binding response OmpR family regulator